MICHAKCRCNCQMPGAESAEELLRRPEEYGDAAPAGMPPDATEIAPRPGRPAGH